MPKKGKRKKTSTPSQSLIEIGSQNLKNWNFLKVKLNFENDSDFVEYLLSIAEKYLCSKLIRFGDKKSFEPEPVPSVEDTVKFKKKHKVPEVPDEAKVATTDDEVLQQENRPKLCTYCDQKHGSSDCPFLHPIFKVEDSKADFDTEDYAVSTLPPSLGLREVDGQKTIFTKIGFKKGTAFGPLVGVQIKEMEIADDYSMKHIWEVGERSYLSTMDRQKSNWIRWMKPAATRSERNVVPVTIEEELVFVSTEDIPSGHELFYWAEMKGSWASKKMEKTSCGGCNLQFAHPMHYRVHCSVFHEASLSLTVRKYHCKVCGKSVLGKQNIMKHALLQHDGKGAYQCRFCSKFFLRLNYLEMHRNYGCSANPHRTRPLCDYCGRKFCQPQKLKVHIKRMHSDLSEVLQEFQCRDCLKVLGSRAALQRHTKEVHKRPSGVSCSKCSKTFQNKSNLKIHMLTHSGVKPFQCGTSGCAAAFTTKQCLQFHYRKVHNLNEDQFPRIVRSVEYTFESYSGQGGPDESVEQSESISSVESHKTSDEQNVNSRVQDPIETSVIEYTSSSLAVKDKDGNKYPHKEYSPGNRVEVEPCSTFGSISSRLDGAALGSATQRSPSPEPAPEVPRLPSPLQRPVTPPTYPSPPRYERIYLPSPPHEFLPDDRYREEAQNLTKYKYDERNVYHELIPRYPIYDPYPPWDVLRPLNMQQSVDLSLSSTSAPMERPTSPYQPFHIPHKSPVYHHFSSYY